MGPVGVDLATALRFQMGGNTQTGGYALMGFTPGYHLFAPLVLPHLIFASLFATGKLVE